MTFITTSVHNLINGVSQQPDSLRLPGQANRQENAYSSPIDGLQKRHPTEHVAKAINGAAGECKVHVINRDSVERYVVLVLNGSLKVFTTAGAEVQVHAAGGGVADFATYLTLATPQQDIRCLTVEDYTFVCNRKKVAALKINLTPADPSLRKAFLFVTRGNYKTDYQVKIQRSGGGLSTQTITSWDGTTALNVANVWTLQILTTGNIGTTWTVTTLGSASTRLVSGIDTPASIAASLSATINGQPNVSASVIGDTITITGDFIGQTITPTVTPSTTGTFTLTQVTPAGNTELTSIQTDDIASALAAKINALSGFTASSVGAVIQIDSTTDITTLDTLDSVGDTTLQRVWKTVTNLTDLPLICLDGFIVKIVGVSADTADDFYVKFVADTAGAFGRGHWVESLGFAIKYQLDPDTMPWQLIRKQDNGAGAVTGTPFAIYFQWSQATWTDRGFGDDGTNPAPSFIGKTIADIFFHRNRLGVISDQNVILSEAALYFNFWRTTVQQLLDSDPIDVSSAHVSVSILHAAVPFDKQLVLFSDRTQFVLDGEPLLTPRTASIKPTLEYENLSTVRPVANAQGLFFAHARGTFSAIHEMYPIDTNDKWQADDVSAQVPRYLAGSAIEFAVSALEDMLFVLCSNDQGALYAYKFYWMSGQKVQSGWSRYTFGTGATVRGAAFIQNTLYVVIQRTEGLFIEKMTIAPGQVDDNATYITYLDRRLTDASAGVSRVYDLPTNRTTITLPYNVEAGETTQVVSRSTGTDDGGHVLTVLSSVTNQIVVQGDHHDDALWIGQRFTMRYEPSKVILREATSERGRAPVVTGRLQVLAGTIAYARSAFFRVLVTPRNRGTFTDILNRILGSQNNVLGHAEFEDGALRFSVLAKNDEVSVVIENDSPLPSNLQNIEWEADYYSKTVRYLS